MPAITTKSCCLNDFHQPIQVDDSPLTIVNNFIVSKEINKFLNTFTYKCHAIQSINEIKKHIWRMTLRAVCQSRKNLSGHFYK